ncbi:hypothetical protein GCM10023145_07540 [Angustibacter luteus]
MLYGSVARGTQGDDSDIDVLELVSGDAATYQVGTINVTQYRPAHLRALAAQGSLFVLHLRTDGVVIEDRFGLLTRTLEAYERPLTYAPIWDQLATAAGVLDVSAHDVRGYLRGLGRLGVYIARTAAYLRSVEAGEVNFDIGLLSQQLDQPGLADAVALRRQATFSLSDIAKLRHEIERIVPNVPSGPIESVESYAIAHADHGELAMLMATVLTDEDELEYSALTLPPF